jgi:hypothetical protein
MGNKMLPASQDIRTMPLPSREDNNPLPVDQALVSFRAQMVVDKSEGFSAEPAAPALGVFSEVLRILNKEHPEYDPKDFQIYVATPLAVDSTLTGVAQVDNVNGNTALGDLIYPGSHVFFVRTGRGQVHLEIWIHKQKIEVFDKRRLLIGRPDRENQINPDIDLTPFLGEYATRISRKQAWLLEENGRWYVKVDEKANSLVFLNNKQKLQAGVNYEILDEYRLGFGGVPEQSLLYMTLRISRY